MTDLLLQARSTTPNRTSAGRRAIVWRNHRVGLRVDVRTVVVCGTLGTLTMFLGLVGLATGDYRLGLGQVVSALFDDTSFAHTVVWDWRLPRVLVSIVFGAALGVSGAIFQSLTRNPLASPDIIGFSTGAYSGALLVIIFVGGGYLEVAGGALVGGIAAAGLVYLLAYKQGIQGFRLIVVGIAVSAMASSFNTYLLLVSDHNAAITGAVWGAGSLNGTSWEQAGLSLVAIAPLFAAAVGLARPLGQMELGDDAARALGVRVEPARLGLIVVGVALIAAVTAVAGPIAFVALAAPQIGKRLARTAGVTLLPAAFVGALLLCAADLAAQRLLPQALPVGLVTVVVGGLYLIWLLVGEARRRM